MKLNREEYIDKVHACFIGKNIGGTIGGPTEGKREILDVKGFSTPKGQPLPNDDLDLQLIWLRALEMQGPQNINSEVLGRYWLNFIPLLGRNMESANTTCSKASNRGYPVLAISISGAILTAPGFAVKFGRPRIR